MKSGRIVEVGTPSEIYYTPKTLFAANFVGEANLLEGKVTSTDIEQCTVDITGHEVRVPNREESWRESNRIDST